MDRNHFLWLLSLNAILLIGKAKEINSSTASSVTGVEADLIALNTNSLQLIWNSPLNSSDVIIVEYAIERENQTLYTIEHDNKTYSYNYTITGLDPGVNYTIVLNVKYFIEVQDTTAVQYTTTVTVLETTSTNAPTTASTTVTIPEANTTSAQTTTSTSSVVIASDLRGWIPQDEQIQLFNNTYPETPINVILAGRDTQSLTFSWYQEGEADDCCMWIENFTETTSNCSFFTNEYAKGTISGLPVAGGQYTVFVVSIRGGLTSNSTETMPDRTLPPNPGAPQCTSHTNTSLTFTIPTPCLSGACELDGYEVIIQSLIDFFPYSNELQVVANESSEILMTVDGLTAGVTYNITLTTTVTNVSSAGSNSNNCAAELNIPLITDIINTTEGTIEASWQTPFGYFDGFKLSCTGQHSARHVLTIHYQNQTSNNTSVQLTSECSSVTAGALYEVNVASVLLDLSETSNASESVLNVTVPYAPKEVVPSNATTDLIHLSLKYGYNSSESQCTHFEVTNVTDTETVLTVPKDNPAIFSGLKADALYNFSTYAVSNYTQVDPPSSPYLWRRSFNSTPSSAWTLAPSVSNIVELEREPWSLLVQFNQTDPHDHVWQYVVHVNTTSGRFRTINLTCSDVDAEEILSTLNCDTNSDVQIDTESVFCRTITSCDRSTSSELPDSTRVTEVTSVVGSTGTTADEQQEATKVYESKRNAELLDDSTALSICFNISDLEPYINYSISVQAVNPGGCSLMETTTLITEEWIPGCVNITHINERSHSIDVYWTAPDKPNGLITQYVINITALGFPTVIATTNSTTFYLIQFLPAYTNYTVTVAAMTNVGVGQVSECPRSVTSATTKIGRPLTPSLIVYPISATSINITWWFLKDQKTGPETYFNLTITDNMNATWIMEEHVEGFDSRWIVVEGLDEYWPYTVAIRAYTINEIGQELTTEGYPVPVRTNESTPGPVEFFNTTSLSSLKQCNATRVEWIQPTERELNGNILGYQLHWKETNGEEFVRNYSNQTRSADVTVQPNGKAYTFTIMAATSIGLGTSRQSAVESTGYCAPSPLIVEDIFGEATAYTKTSFTVLYDATMFKENSNGPVTASALLVAEESDTLNNTDGYGTYELLSNALTWSVAVKNGPIPEYRPTPDSWLNDNSGGASSRHRREVSNTTYIVGYNEACDGVQGFCNGQLPSGRKFRVRGVICTQPDECYKTKFLSITFITAADDMAWIAGVVIGVLAVILLVALLIYFFYFRKRRYGSESSDKEMDVNFTMPPMEVAKPVRIVDFPARVVEMHRNSDLEFNDEYQAIQNQSARLPWTAAEQPRNRVKNRFVNILPFDHSRVPLRTTAANEEDSESDYINANYIPNDDGIREFIACQGPLESTVDDFWRMVWEHNCRVIVMLTNLKEKGREKCAQYWPVRGNDPTRYRNIDVNLMSESLMDYYVVRSFKVSAGTQTREVLQFHFISWPDFGVPAEPEKVLAFVREVRSYAGDRVDPPIVVHCSAGVGRTGTFIVLDRLLRELPRAHTIDIFRMVLQLRENRCLMVQTEAQYVFIHDCMKLEIERTQQLYSNQSYNAYDEDSFNDEPIYQNANQSDNSNVDLKTFKYD